MKKKVLSVLLASMLVFSFVACGNQETVNEKDPVKEQESSASSKEVASEEVVQPEKIEKFDSLVTMTSARYNPGAAVSINLAGDDLENNAWTRMLEEKYNIDVKYDWLADSSDSYTQKVDLMLASGEIPDFFEVNARQFAELRDAGLIQSVGDVYELYANENVRNVIEGEGGEKVMEAVTFGGEMMAIPNTNAPKENAPLLYLRKDWLDNLGLDVPETTNDVIAIAEAFASQDPDQNGKDDTYAWSMTSNPLSRLSALLYANNSWPGSYVVNEDGELTNSYTSEGTKAVLELVSEWNKKGYIDPEWFTKDGSKANELIVNSQVGIYVSVYSDVGAMQQQHSLDPNSEWLVMAFPGYDGKPVTTPYSLPIGSYWVVSKECEHPEAVIMMLNEWMDLFYFNTDDELYVEFNRAEDGSSIWQNTPIRSLSGFKNMNCGLNMTDYFAGKKNLEELTPEERMNIARVEAAQAGDLTTYNWTLIYQAMANVSKYVENDSYIYNVFWDTPTETMQTNGTIIKDYALEFFTNLINGKESFDNWDVFVKEYNKLGYEDIISEVAEWYESKK